MRTWRVKTFATLSLCMVFGLLAAASSNSERGAGYARSQERYFDSLMFSVRQTSLLGNGIAVTHPRMVSLSRFLHLPKPAKSPPVYDSELATVYSELGLAGFLAWYSLRITLLLLPFRAFKEAASGEARALHLSFALIQLAGIFSPFVFNATTALLVTAAAGLALRTEPTSDTA